MTHSASRYRVFALLLCGSGLGGSAHAADSSELWPELSAFVAMTPRTRVYLDASYARGMDSSARSLDLSGFVDVALEPILREQLRTEDWQRSRFLWTRIGYTRVFKSSDGSTTAAEDRVSAALYAKTELPAEVRLEGRARVDLRWIGGDYSSRQRLRLEVNREFTVQEHAVVPYFQIEGFYDTRYHGWSRMLYQPGVEITLDSHFRLELYLARQNDRLPEEERLDALGIVAKWYY
jgi:hypothetical protein